MPLTPVVACTNVYGVDVLLWLVEMLSFNQFAPEFDPEGEAPIEIKTLWLQQNISDG